MDNLISLFFSNWHWGCFGIFSFDIRVSIFLLISFCSYLGIREKNYQKNKDLLAGMNNIINQLDSKILNDDLLNQTY